MGLRSYLGLREVTWSPVAVDEVASGCIGAGGRNGGGVLVGLALQRRLPDARRVQAEGSAGLAWQYTWATSTTGRFTLYPAAGTRQG